MKNGILLFLLSLLLPLVAAAQSTYPEILEITHAKTTSLVFPYPVKSVDRGSADLLAQVPPEAENVLQLKAARKGFEETNLTVITADGRLYSFPVRYAANPSTTVLQLDPASTGAAPVLLKGPEMNAEELEAACNRVAESPGGSDVHVRSKAGRCLARLEGIYSRGNILFYKVVLTNRSPIPYTIDVARFSVRDRRQARRTATQEEEVLPLYAYGLEAKTLAPGKRQTLVFALEKHTLAAGKELVIGLFENKGGRHLQLHVRDRHVLRARPLPLPYLP